MYFGGVEEGVAGHVEEVLLVSVKNVGGSIVDELFY